LQTPEDVSRQQLSEVPKGRSTLAQDFSPGKSATSIAQVPQGWPEC